MKYISWGYYAIEAINIQLWTNVKNITCESPNSINFCYFFKGPIFGGIAEGFEFDDLHIADNANTNEESFSRLGNNFQHPEYEFSSKEAKSFLAGSEFFRLNEIEVFIKI